MVLFEFLGKSSSNSYKYRRRCSCACWLIVRHGGPVSGSNFRPMVQVVRGESEGEIRGKMEFEEREIEMKNERNLMEACLNTPSMCIRWATSDILSATGFVEFLGQLRASMRFIHTLISMLPQIIIVDPVDPLMVNWSSAPSSIFNWPW